MDVNGLTVVSTDNHFLLSNNSVKFSGNNCNFIVFFRFGAQNFREILIYVIYSYLSAFQM